MLDIMTAFGLAILVLWFLYVLFETQIGPALVIICLTVFFIACVSVAVYRIGSYVLYLL